ncbi:MAG: outer membrane lipoprotein carrier protein LolA [Bacteroides sp.]|nr:outer membrane lipoprotein carrier protein LolA [Prevotella sp.]MCM1406864.1 outer membrane lipoprotein carrier protein LolA [Treponema brennaborense]MCM1470807.1 outer membrane lipoprotein carrier protein LolA [Bacteroides sp.]
MKNENRLKKIFFYLFFCLFSAESNFAAAQNNSFPDVLNFFSKNKVICGDFVQEKFSPKLNRPLKSEGTFLFSEEGFFWRTLKPFPSSTAVTRNSIIQTKRDGTKIIFDGAQNSVFQSAAQTVSSVLRGEITEMEKFFGVENFASDSKNWSLVLIPQNADFAQIIAKIELSGAVEQNPSAPFYSLDVIKIFQTQDEIISYSLQNKIYKRELTDEEKSFFE